VRVRAERIDPSATARVLRWLEKLREQARDQRTGALKCAVRLIRPHPASQWQLFASEIPKPTMQRELWY